MGQATKPTQVQAPSPRPDTRPQPCAQAGGQTAKDPQHDSDDRRKPQVISRKIFSDFASL